MVMVEVEDDAHARRGAALVGGLTDRELAGGAVMPRCEIFRGGVSYWMYVSDGCWVVMVGLGSS